MFWKKKTLDKSNKHKQNLFWKTKQNKTFFKKKTTCEKKKTIGKKHNKPRCKTNLEKYILATKKKNNNKQTTTNKQQQAKKTFAKQNPSQKKTKRRIT